MDTNTYTSDTGWTTQTNKRNHSSSSNSTSNPSSPTASNLNKKNKIFATPNRFQSLAQDEPSQKLSNEANPQDCVETDEEDNWIFRTLFLAPIYDLAMRPC
ncbi:hypothetical protein ACI65C_006329 [Semiaphis heraclei]